MIYGYTMYVQPLHRDVFFQTNKTRKTDALALDFIESLLIYTNVTCSTDKKAIDAIKHELQPASLEFVNAVKPYYKLKGKYFSATLFREDIVIFGHQERVI